jgi:hypothetical protein
MRNFEVLVWVCDAVWCQYSLCNGMDLDLDTLHKFILRWWGHILHQQPSKKNGREKTAALIVKWLRNAHIGCMSVTIGRLVSFFLFNRFHISHFVSLPYLPPSILTRATTPIASSAIAFSSSQSQLGHKSGLEAIQP